MKHLGSYLVVAICMICSSVAAQTDVKLTRPEFSQSPTAKFRLFPTQNIWTYIKLDTSNGKLWVVMYSMSADNRGEVPLSIYPRCSANESKNGRFTLYSTTNIYTFIMLDQENGKMWQVQWGNELSALQVMPIN